MPFPWGAVIQGGSNITSSAVQNSGSRKSQKRALRYNLDFWRQQNEYNSPVAQMKCLREAGLNPNLIYGQSASGATGQAERIAPAKAAEYKFESPLRNITSFSDVRQKEATSDNLKVQKTVLTQEAILKAAQTGKVLSEGSSAATKAKVDKALLDTSVDASKENLRQMELGTIGKQLDNTFKSQTIKNRVKDINYRVQNAKETLKGQKLLNALRSLERDLKQIGIERNDPWYLRIFGRALGKEGFDDIINNSKKR